MHMSGRACTYSHLDHDDVACDRGVAEGGVQEWDLHHVGGRLGHQVGLGRVPQLLPLETEIEFRVGELERVTMQAWRGTGA